jgi:hypothetical protein
MTRVSPHAAVVFTLSVGLAACDVQHSSNATSPSSVANGASGTVGSLLGVWTSGAPAGSSVPVPDPKSCNNFQWAITQQTANAVTGTFSAVCMNSISLSGTANGQLVGTSVPMVVNGTATLPGLGNCTFTINGTGYIEDSGNSLRIPYSATSCIGPFSGEETLRRPQPAAPAPTPTPAPPAAPAPPPPPPPPSSPDQIDLNQVQIMLGPNVATWPQTSTVTSTTAVDHQLCIYHTKLGQWPSTIFFDDPSTLVEGNQWIFANINGQWYGGAGDWYRPGQACKDVTPQSIAHDAFYSDNMEPLRSWVPQPGEVFGLMSSTPARAWPAMRTLDERTNVVLVHWGQ